MPPRLLMNFDQIFTKSDQILTIYDKNDQMHVEKFQECHFLKIKKSNVNNHPENKSNVKNQPGFGVWGEKMGYWEGNI